ncbi:MULTISPECIES: helix-turn-helix transcriptional regulator [Rhodomicrobium]|uniref:helix-turn-helix domain-containing protein n=1 Tax=Rhodomicrobium TaxID=1068 RepID=UPI000B4AC2DD|nr:MULTISPECIES: helix-turn-helix transcriptional regulator [Rhodomicrobium]
MSGRSEQSLADEESRAAASSIAEELARRRMTRQQLAALAKISLSTLEKALSGRRPFTLATLVRIEEALAVNLRQRNSVPLNDTPFGLAPDGLGSYSRPAVAWMEGDYVTLRPSFSEPEAIYAYLTQIRWDQVASNLVFTESERIDAEYTQGGVVSAPHQSGHIYLVTNKHGQYRLIIVARPTIRGELHGILTTLQVGRGAQLTPVATPIVLTPLKAMPSAEFGRIKPGQPCYAPYRGLLRRTVEEPFALFLKAV